MCWIMLSMASASRNGNELRRGAAKQAVERGTMSAATEAVLVRTGFETI
jgi:hypothetical protein